MTRVLVTGGAGYIGSHVVKALGERGYDTIIYDNLSTGYEDSVIYGKLIRGDILDFNMLKQTLEDYKPNAVMHFAAYISVPESVENPVKYYINNLSGSLNLIKALRECGINNMIFSSSAAVYGIPKEVPITEDAPMSPINPYGTSKAVVERVLKDVSDCSNFNHVSLRYFNAAGADTEGKLGEKKKEASHLITMCVRTALGSNPYLNIYGTDYDTPDGTCIRDYVHVEDLAEAHILALEYLLNGGESQSFNCGCSSGYSVLEAVRTAKKVTGVDFPVKYAKRRPGDPPVLVSDSSKIREVLGWKPKYDNIEYIIKTAWDWEKKL